jgi:uncharacterized OB-fold protein
MFRTQAASRLWSCPDCGKGRSSNPAAACPHCGRPSEDDLYIHRHGGRILAWVLFLAAAFAAAYVVFAMLRLKASAP